MESKKLLLGSSIISAAKRLLKSRIILFFIMLILLSLKKGNDEEKKMYAVVYVQTNNFANNQNAVIAYKVKSNGKLSQIKGSPFLTQGSGVGNPLQDLGPLDSDYELRLSSDGKYLLTVIC